MESKSEKCVAPVDSQEMSTLKSNSIITFVHPYRHPSLAAVANALASDISTGHQALTLLFAANKIIPS